MSPAFIPRFTAPPEKLVRQAGQLAVLIVASAGSWLLAGLLWEFMVGTASPVDSRASHPGPIGERLAVQLHFSGAHQATPVPVNLMLVGVSASTDPRQARALIRREGQSQLLVLSIGDEVSPGLRLSRIESSQVILSGANGESRLALPKSEPLLPEPPPHD